MDERNLSPEMKEVLKLRYARMQAFKQLSDVEAAEMQMIIRKAVGVDLTNPAERWELDLERGVLRRVESKQSE